MIEEQVNRQLQLIEDKTNEMCKSKQSCIDFLMKSGILDKYGKLSRRYGG
jgi:hypothetical protein